MKASQIIQPNFLKHPCDLGLRKLRQLHDLHNILRFTIDRYFREVLYNKLRLGLASQERRQNSRLLVCFFVLAFWWEMYAGIGLTWRA